MAGESKKLSVLQINAMIKEAKYSWIAAETSLSKLSEEEQNRRLGLDAYLDVHEAERQRIESILSKKETSAPRSFSSNSDWRNKNGKNWVTPVRDQGSCGSCVAFGTVATIEYQAKIQYDDPSWDLNLSEADLFFCGAGRRCTQGWWPTYALDYAKDKGIAEEACFPYQDQDVDCTLCSDKANRSLKVEKWYEIISINERKEWLDKKGPLVACMAVYRDFFSYKEGVYRHVTGDLAGYHAIACVGYSEEEQCWICKNSWGTSWGDKGFFKIAYGQAEMDTQFAKYGVENLTGTLKPKNKIVCNSAEYLVVDHSFANNRSVLWAYVDGKWHYQMVSDTQLAGMAKIVFETSPVQVCYQDDKIIQIQGWKKLS